MSRSPAVPIPTQSPSRETVTGIVSRLHGLSGALYVAEEKIRRLEEVTSSLYTQKRLLSDRVIALELAHARIMGALRSGVQMSAAEVCNDRVGTMRPVKSVVDEKGEINGCGPGIDVHEHARDGTDGVAKDEDSDNGEYSCIIIESGGAGDILGKRRHAAP